MPDEQADNEEDNKEERSAVVQEDVEGAPSALWSRLAGMADHPAEIDDIGCQDEPTDAEPRAQSHEAIFAFRGKVVPLGQCSGMTPECRVRDRDTCSVAWSRWLVPDRG